MSKPGHTNNPHGRARGSINKRTRRILELMKENNYDPALELILEAKDPTCPPEVRRENAKILMPFAYPKLASTDVNVQVDDNRRPEKLDDINRILEAEFVIVDQKDGKEAVLAKPTPRDVGEFADVRAEFETARGDDG